VFVIRGTTAENLILVCLSIFAAALIGLAALNALRPLATGETREPEMVGSRTRGRSSARKNLLLRSIKELEFDARDGQGRPKGTTKKWSAAALARGAAASAARHTSSGTGN
jgi:hypothetical protein